MNNPYSKYRYDNNLSVKVRGDEDVVDVLGAGLRPATDNIRDLVGSALPALGVTEVVNHIYKVNRINNVDSKVTADSYQGPTYFKLFKL